MPRWPERDTNPISIEDRKRFLIPLTRGLFAKVDAEDLALVNIGPWNAHEHPGGKMYAMQDAGRIKGKKRLIYMHRIIMGVTNPDIEVDHENRSETLNNTRENLRIATRSQQIFNTKIRSDSETGYKGVHLHKPNGKYNAYLNIDGRRYSFGYYVMAIDAARARDIGAIQIQREFASLNFPREDYGEVPPYIKVDHRKGARNKKA